MSTCPHCGRRTTAVLSGRYVCAPDRGGCGKAFTIGGATTRPRAAGLHQMNPAFRFVGGHVGSASGRGGDGSGETPFRVNIQAPNPKFAEALKVWNGALELLSNQLHGLLGAAEDPMEQEFWEATLKRLHLR